MKSVIIANSQAEEAGVLEQYLGRYFNVSVLPDASTPDREKMARADLILIDHNFTANSGIDFLMDILRRHNLPTLMLTPAGDPQCAIEALRVGAFNYIVKTKGYLRFLNIAIDDALTKFQERRQLKDTISDLKGKLSVLEGKNGTRAVPAREKPFPAMSKPGGEPKKEGTPAPLEPVKELNLMEEIVSRFKKGEVNLPTLPDINIRFNKLIKRGANLREVADFLKQDVAITSKLINVANSALYRGIEKTTRLEDAISKLGLGKTRQYVEIIANRSLYTSTNKRFGSFIEKLWEHSLATAYAAEYILNLLHLQTNVDIFSLGLTHDVGKLILVQVIGELEAKSRTGEKFDNAKILSTLKLYHGKFGAVLLNRWGFPQEFKDVAMYHDHMEKVTKPSPEFLCVHFANLLAVSLGYTMESGREVDMENTDSGYLLRLRPDDIQQAVEQTTQYISGIKQAI